MDSTSTVHVQYTRILITCSQKSGNFKSTKSLIQYEYTSTVFHAALLETTPLTKSSTSPGGLRGLMQQQASPSTSKDPNWNSSARDLNSNPNPNHIQSNQQDAERVEKEPSAAVGEDTAVRCAVCEREIAVESERTVYRVGECGLVHDACLRCSMCGRSLADDGRCFVRERDPHTLLCRADFYR